MLIFLLLCGLGVGILSGMLGIGGGIVMTPLLLYLPGMVGLVTVSMSQVTGLTMVQGLVAGMTGFWAYRRRGTVLLPLVYWMGPVIMAASFAGAHWSKYASSSLLTGLFAVMALLASILILLPEQKSLGVRAEEAVQFSKGRAMSVAAVVGFLGGLVGQGGSFLLIPAMTGLLGMSTRVAMGTNLGIIILASLAGVSGKVSAGLITLAPALALALGAIIGTLIGSRLNSLVRTPALKRLLAAIILFVGIRTLADALAVPARNALDLVPLPLRVPAVVLISLTVANTVVLAWVISYLRRRPHVSAAGFLRETDGSSITSTIACDTLTGTGTQS